MTSHNNEYFLAGTEVCKNKLSTCTAPATIDKCKYLKILKQFGINSNELSGIF